MEPRFTEQDLIDYEVDALAILHASKPGENTNWADALGAAKVINEVPDVSMYYP